MFSLPETWFIPVPIQHFNSELFWINKYHENDLKELNNQVRSLKKNSLSFESNLGLVTKLASNSFYENKEWDEYLKTVFYLKSDRFFNPYSPDLGSGRNVLLGKACWKGVGRNFAATRIENSHSSGKLGLNTALTEIYFDYVLREFAPDLMVPIWAAGLYKNQSSAFLIRSGEVIRCSQIPGYIKTKEKDIFKNYIKDNLPIMPEDEWFEFIIFRIASYLAKGFYHFSATSDNITIDGRFIDNQSIEWLKFNGDNFLFTQIYLKNADEKLANQLFYRDFNHVDVSKISNFATQVNSLKHSHYALKNAFNSIGLKTISWEKMKKKLVDIVNLPEFFFSLDPELIPQKFEFLKDFIERNKTTNPIESEKIDNLKVYINSGNRMNTKTHELFKKLVLTYILGNNKSISSDELMEILNRVLLKSKLTKSICRKKFN